MSSSKRLELCTAVLAARVKKRITQERKLKIKEVLFYTDSKVILGYIQNESRRFYVYVANRIQIIRSITELTYWKYVVSTKNPADMTRRGKPAKQLMKSSWFEGPEFLKKVGTSEIAHQNINPVEFPINEKDPEFQEDAKIYTTEVTELHKIRSLGSDRFTKFSSWIPFRRAIANLLIKAKLWKIRSLTSTFVNQKTVQSQLNLPLFVPRLRNPSATELRQSETVTIKTVQRETYGEEIIALQSSQETVPPKSSLYTLDPLFDNGGVLRVGRQLKQADQMLQDHSAIISKRCHLAKLV